MTRFAVRRTFAELWLSEGRDHALDGIRAVCILWTMAFHTFWIAGLRPGARLDEITGVLSDPRLRLVMRGDFAVDALFVLSGFFAGRALLSELGRTGTIALGRFYRRRLLRIVPSYLVVMLLVALPDRQDLPLAWANVLYVNNYVSILREFMVWTWSLAVDMQLYLAFPVLVKAIGARPTQRLVLWLVLLAAAFAVRAAAVAATGLTLPITAHPRVDLAAFARYFDGLYQGTHTRYGAFLAGILAAELERRGVAIALAGKPAWARGGAVLAAAVALGLMLPSIADPGCAWSRAASALYLTAFPYLFSLATAYVVLFCVAPRASRVARVLGARVLMPVARLSYPLFLIHPLIMFLGYFTILERAPSTLGARAFAFVGFVVVSLVAAAALHVFVEAPALRARERAR
jgi:peptidoglycan/LPS O-acetylase OafA/YrhL